MTTFELRPWVPADVKSLVHHANNWNIARYMTDKFPHPYTEEAGSTFIEFATKDNPIRIFAISVNGAAVGGIGLHPREDIYRLNAEIGYWLGEQYWGQGIISAAIGGLVNFAFSNFELQRIFAGTFGSNLASQRVLEKNGFELEVRRKLALIKQGIMEDELMYALTKDKWLKNNNT